MIRFLFEIIQVTPTKTAELFIYCQMSKIEYFRLFMDNDDG